MTYRLNPYEHGWALEKPSGEKNKSWRAFKWSNTFEGIVSILREQLLRDLGPLDPTNDEILSRTGRVEDLIAASLARLRRPQRALIPNFEASGL